MKPQKGILWLLVGVCLILSLPTRGEAKPLILKLATLAPDGSAWMKAFDRVESELQSKTGGDLKLRVYPGGVMGDDQAVLRKMRIGQIHLGGITGIGLGVVCKDTQVLGMPFLFESYDEVDYVLSKVTERFEQVFQEKGYVLISWSEIGFVYMMANKPITSLEALQGSKVWMPEGDPVSRAVLQKAGVSPIPLGISDVLLALQTGLVDVIYSPPIGAIALQWFTKVKYVTRVPLSYSLGAVVMTNKAFESIPTDHQHAFLETFRTNLATLNVQTRKDNEEALLVMAQEGIEIVDVPPEELARFQRIAKEVTEEIAGKVFPAERLEEIRGHLSEVRGKK
jgi:TRAP-type C4-dicarboxylate transport system substrate-binding protein